MTKGTFVSTPFGAGIISSNRKTDGVCVVELPYGTLYAPTERILQQQKRAMELNVAYEALDKMRKLNLEVECRRLGLKDVNHNQCTTCLLTPRPKRRFAPRIQRLVQESCSNLKQVQACISCGSPVCGQHSSPQFRKEAIPVCVGCERLFTLDFVMDCMTCSPEKRLENVNHMMDIYDRVLLLFKYSMQFVDQVALQLQETTRTHNKVSVGSSSVGMLSGVLGMAAAATILTPAGPPLLIASLLFGGSATAVQTGTEVRNYYSEPNRLAGRIFALNGIVHSILKTTGILRDALLRDYLRKDGLDESDQKQVLHQEVIQKESAVMAGLTVGRYGAVGVEVGSLASVAEVSCVARSASFATKTVSALQVARFAGGALSAATLVVETKCMADTIQQIQAGNPCEKADMLNQIKKEFDELPTTESLDRECMSYLEAMAQRKRRMTEEEVVRLLMDASKLEDYIDEGTASLDESHDDDTSPLPSTIESQGSEPEPPKDNPKLSASLIERIKMYKNRSNKDVLTTDDSPDAVPMSLV
jgi:hypothetical protein